MIQDTAGRDLDNSEFTNDSWTEFVDSIRGGNSDTMERLYRHFGQGVKFCFYRAFGPRDIDDHVHDCFVIVAESIIKGHLRDPTRLLPFIRTIVRRRISALIEDATLSRNTVVRIDDVAYKVRDRTATPEEAFEDREDALLVAATLKDIPPRDREILIRFYVDNQDYTTICRDLGLTYNQFRLLKWRAKARFGRLGKVIRAARSTNVKEVKPAHGD